jgi:hypothetical protein
MTPRKAVDADMILPDFTKEIFFMRQSKSFITYSLLDIWIAKTFFPEVPRTPDALQHPDNVSPIGDRCTSHRSHFPKELVARTEQSRRFFQIENQPENAKREDSCSESSVLQLDPLSNLDPLKRHGIPTLPRRLTE